MIVDARMIECLEYFVLPHEGKICEDVPGDPGGRTFWGIIQTEYDSWRIAQKEPTRSVCSATKDEVYAVYQEHYWAPMNCDSLPKPLDLVTFDCAVNMGNHRAQHFLNSTQGTQDSVQRAKEFIAEREDAYRILVDAHSGLAKFLKGWLQRCEDLKSHL